jgi:hypothetical protein
MTKLTASLCNFRALRRQKPKFGGGEELLGCEAVKIGAEMSTFYEELATLTFQDRKHGPRG